MAANRNRAASPDAGPGLFGEAPPPLGPVAPLDAPGDVPGDAPRGSRPLADRLRPQSLEAVVGQDHLVGPDGALTRMLARGSLGSLILWGPPGVGKTTIARLLAARAGLAFVALSAVFSGVADLKRAFEEARARRRPSQGTAQGTLLMVDEIHRFNRAQQDGFLPVVEDGTVTLVGATTENPSFALNGALLSRCRVLVLRRLDDAAQASLVARAETEAGRRLPLDDAARAALWAMADGDGRTLLNLVEQVLALPEGEPALDPAALMDLLARHDPSFPGFLAGANDQTTLLLSAFHKSLRGSDVQAALYYAARLLVGGPEAAPTVFRRLACAASEDVGMADPGALVQVVTAWQAFERTGWPEGRLFLAQAIAYVATAPKSNAAHVAFDEALELARRTANVPPPLHILNAPTRLMTGMGYGKGYRYDHDELDAFSGQEFFPETLVPERPGFYRPSGRGFEHDVQQRLERWAELKRRRQGAGDGEEP